MRLNSVCPSISMNTSTKALILLMLMDSWREAPLQAFLAPAHVQSFRIRAGTRVFLGEKDSMSL